MTYVARVRAVSTGWMGGPGLNTFYFTKTESAPEVMPDHSDAILCVDRVRAAFAAAPNLYPTTWSVQVSPDVDVLVAETGELVNSHSVPGVTAVAGVNVGGFGPLHSMLLIQLRTSTFDDGSRIGGRVFLGPGAPSADTNGTPNAGILTYANAFATAIDNTGIGDNPKLVVWRRPREADPDHLPEPVTARDGRTAPVTSRLVPDKYAVLRSRRD